MVIPFTFLFFLSLVILMTITYLKPNSNLCVVFKTLTSLGFLTIGTIGYLLGNGIPSATYLLLGLVLCVIGDVALAFSHGYPLQYNMPAAIGITSFGCAHLSFIYCFILLGASIPMYYVFIPIIIAFNIFLIMIKDPFNFGAMRFLVAIYAFIITFMLIAAFCTHSPFIIFGAILFVLSDIILCFVYFFADRYPILRSINYLLYYSGQLLLAFVLCTL
ncbi:lysoplasmalogenase family protein [Niameybacter massiliensis]|uniref:lysoplasmalogenase family protein n=1 Tax=Niameybacter massiliensis TaxID=1658108 RepID=UPI0006B48F81|nr:lysoplasmalogenase family protein [Niameybacter massiliensis]